MVARVHDGGVDLPRGKRRSAWDFLTGLAALIASVHGGETPADPGYIALALGTHVVGPVLKAEDPEVPGQTPGAGAVVRSSRDGALQIITLLLPTTAVAAKAEAPAGGATSRLLPDSLLRATRLLVLVNSGLVVPRSGREISLLALNEAKQNKVVGKLLFESPGWRCLAVEVPTLFNGSAVTALALVASGPAPFYCAGGMVHGDQQAQVSDLPTLPNPLLPIGYADTRGLRETLLRMMRVREAFPELTGLRLLAPGIGTTGDLAQARRTLAAFTTAWGGDGKPGDGAISWYGAPEVMRPPLDQAVSAGSALLVVVLPTARSPAQSFDVIAGALHTAAVRSGSWPVLVCDEGCLKARKRNEWRTWIQIARDNCPALPVIDLATVVEWHTRADGDAAKTAITPEQLAAAFALGVRDLRTRLGVAHAEALVTWLEIKDKLPPNPPPGNTPGNRPPGTGTTRPRFPPGIRPRP